MLIVAYHAAPHLQEVRYFLIKPYEQGGGLTIIRLCPDDMP